MMEMNKYIGFYWPKYCKEILEWFQEKYTYYINTMLIICKVLLRRVVASWLWLEKRIKSSFENVSDTVVFSNISPSIVPRVVRHLAFHLSMKLVWRWSSSTVHAGLWDGILTLRFFWEYNVNFFSTVCINDHTCIDSYCIS